LHVSFCCTLPEQQSSVALHWFDCKRQMSPFGLQPVGFEQTPALPFMMHVVTPASFFPPPLPPQQSLSL